MTLTADSLSGVRRGRQRRARDPHAIGTRRAPAPSRTARLSLGQRGGGRAHAPQQLLPLSFGQTMVESDELFEPGLAQQRDLLEAAAGALGGRSIVGLAQAPGLLGEQRGIDAIEGALERAV